jgi:tetratricopeptide (TPR) repeat protein
MNVNDLKDLAAIHRERGEAAAAEQLYMETLAAKEKALGPDHPDLAVTFDRLAALFAAQGRSSEARSIYRHALDIFVRALGPAHPHSLACRARYAELHNN